MTNTDSLKPEGAADVVCDGSCACSRQTGTTDGTDRRTFLAKGAAGLAMLALAACGISSATAPSSVPATTVKLSDHPALANAGGVAVLQIGGTPVAIVRETTSTFSAFSLICPHAGNLVQSEGSQGFFCPGHGAQFNLAGRWVGGQPTSNLRSYPVQYDAGAAALTVGG
jgi:Rieske Fe-S protein